MREKFSTQTREAVTGGSHKCKQKFQKPTRSLNRSPEAASKEMRANQSPSKTGGRPCAHLCASLEK